MTKWLFGENVLYILLAYKQVSFVVALLNMILLLNIIHIYNVHGLWGGAVLLGWVRVLSVNLNLYPASNVCLKVNFRGKIVSFRTDYIWIRWKKSEILALSILQKSLNINVYGTWYYFEHLGSFLRLRVFLFDLHYSRVRLVNINVSIFCMHQSISHATIFGIIMFCSRHANYLGNTHLT